ncbi:MAG: DUF362 domain-containing protein [Acidobacteria bacterium]|nr:DUF362 domain-containing protein [Acidobacteriota bacterium]
MPTTFSRRTMLQLTAFAPALRPWRPLFAQEQAPQARRSTVSLVKGDSRRKNAADALAAIDDQLLPVLKTKKYAVIKTNFVSTTNQLAASHPDAVHGILDYLAPRFKGPVMIAEASAGDTMDGFEQFGYNRLAAERKAEKVQLVDLNREATYKVLPLINYDLHAAPARLAARLFDPDAFVICSAMTKTHNVVVASLSVKNMTLGAPLHSVGRSTPRWNDKRVTHNGLRQTVYNIFLTAQAMVPYWHAALIDGYEGMEGNGPSSGTPVPSRIAIASRDFVAADRVAVEAMGINPEWVGYLRYCGDFGIGQYDLSKIDVRGEKVAGVVRKYQLHQDIERQLEWMGPMTDLPKKIG